MPALTGPFAVSILLLLLAGAFKVWQPSPTTNAMDAAGLPNSDALTRGLGVLEIGSATAALVLGGWVPTILVSSLYIGFSIFVVRALRQGIAIQSCGCFGKIDTPPSWAHVVVNSCAAGATAGFGLTARQPLAELLFTIDAIPLLMAVGATSYLVYVLLAIMPTATSARPA